MGGLLLPPVLAALPGSQRRGGRLPPQGSWGFQVAQMVKPLSAMQETGFNPWVGKIPKSQTRLSDFTFPRALPFCPCVWVGLSLWQPPLSDLKAPRVGSGPSIHRALMAESPQAGSKGLGAPVVGDARPLLHSPMGSWDPPPLQEPGRELTAQGDPAAGSTVTWGPQEQDWGFPDAAPTSQPLGT